MNSIDAKQREKKSNLAVNLGLAANIFLAAIKTAVGITGHSPALLADGINSTSDVAYYVVVAVFMRLAHKPADEEHPYGHTQLESIASVVVGSFVITTAVAIFWDAVNKVFDLVNGGDGFGGAAIAALWIALFTVALKIGLSLVTRRIGQQTGNAAVLSLAYDHRNDIFSASAAALGIFLGRAGYPWVDPLAGALVALVILRTGIEILRQSSTELMDAVPSKTLAQQVAAALQAIPEVQEIEQVHAHRFGPYLVINVTIGIDGTMSVADGDCIASRVEDKLYNSIDLARQVYVHYHPARRDCGPRPPDALPPYLAGADDQRKI